jgi:gamma-glutamyl-gamma-aminobutyrate hydrolase PuuD
VSDARPVRIGLTTYREPAAWGVWNEPADLLPVTYSDVVHTVGGLPLLLPPVAANLGSTSDLVECALDAVDGLLLAGGADVAPARYGALRHPSTGDPRPDRDEWELALTRAAIQRGMPVLGVCRGMQVLAVALGGTLLQHLPDATGTDEHCRVVGVHGRHVVRVSPASRLGTAIGPRVEVATYHHQAVDRLPEPLIATAWADDGTIEACEATDGSWTVGVQWHPEVYDETGVVATFVAACRQAVSTGGVR